MRVAALRPPRTTSAATDESAFARAARGTLDQDPQQAPGDAVTFVRQSHGGSALDSRRSRLVLFGSDTHGRDWTNSPLIFDLTTLQWQRPYADDDLASYRVSVLGVAFAGSDGAHPWAMHTFGAVAYDPIADRIVVASYPHHMTPGRFTDVMADRWPQVRRHPTWLFDPGRGKWTVLAGEPIHFFPFSVAYDSKRGVTLGYRRDGVYELSLARQEWRKVAAPGLLDRAATPSTTPVSKRWSYSAVTRKVMKWSPIGRRAATIG